MDIRLTEGKLDIHFRVNADQTVELVNFTALTDTKDLPYQAPANVGGFDAPFKPRQFLAAHVTGECSTGMHAAKHDAGSLAAHRVERVGVRPRIGSLLIGCTRLPSWRRLRCRRGEVEIEVARLGHASAPLRGRSRPRHAGPRWPARDRVPRTRRFPQRTH